VDTTHRELCTQGHKQRPRQPRTFWRPNLAHACPAAR
jgi:hypothetical protein